MRYQSPFRISFALLLGICICLGLAGCGHRPSAAPATSPTLVTVSYPVQRTVTDYVDFTGRTQAVKSVEIRARVDGYLIRMPFKEGTEVQTGDLLFEIDPRPYQAALDYAEGQVASNVAALELAQADNARGKKLAPKGAISQQEFDKYRSSEDQAEATLASSKANLATARLNLAFTRILSPIDGQVSRYNVTEGNLVQSGQAGSGTLLTNIVSVDPIYTHFNVDEQTLLRARKLVRQGRAKSASDAEVPVALGLATEEEFPHQGTINFVDNQVNPQTGTLLVRGVFPNHDRMLSPGLFARVRVQIGEPHQALLVTERAIDTDQGQKILYVVNDQNEVVYRPIRVGALHHGWRVIEEGLEAGERVIVNGLQRVRPGVVVEPKLTDMPASTADRGSAEIPKRPPKSPTKSTRQRKS